MKKYKTILADPPWEIVPIAARPNLSEGCVDARLKRNNGIYKRGTTARKNDFYKTMSIDEISNLDVKSLVEKDSHLYLWTINKFLINGSAYKVAMAWGFKPVQILTWVKKPRGIMLGAYTSTTEFILFCRRGSLKTKQRLDTTWWNFPRHNKHSQKPEDFRKIVESMSHPPYLELFAREKREGWDVWGNEVESDIIL